VTSIARKLRSTVLNVYRKTSDGMRMALNHQMTLHCFMEEVNFVHKEIRSATKRVEFVTDVIPYNAEDMMWLFFNVKICLRIQKHGSPKFMWKDVCNVQGIYII
jgi:hypothetical protein